MARGNYEVLAKAATICAIIFGVSLGLCGMTVLIGSKLNGNLGWIPLGVIELLGMIIGVCGLLIIGLIAIIQSLVSLTSRDKDGQ
jgi:hypothetical protein